MTANSWKGAKTAPIRKFALSGGGSGIRTLEGVTPLLVFKTSALNRSANPPFEFSSRTKRVPTEDQMLA